MQPILANALRLCGGPSWHRAATGEFQARAHYMRIGRLWPIGLVGSRAYELQAWQSPGASALEQAAWQRRHATADITPAPKTRLMRLLAAIPIARALFVRTR